MINKSKITLEKLKFFRKNCALHFIGRGVIKAGMFYHFYCFNDAFDMS